LVLFGLFGLAKYYYIGIINAFFFFIFLGTNYLGNINKMCTCVFFIYFLSVITTILHRVNLLIMLVYKCITGRNCGCVCVVSYTRRDESFKNYIYQLLIGLDTGFVTLLLRPSWWEREREYFYKYDYYGMASMKYVSFWNH